MSKRFLRWLRGEEGWGTLLLLTLVALLPVLAFQDAHWLNKTPEDLAKATLFGAWGTMLLARTRLRSVIALPAGLILGGGWVFAAVGGALPPWSTVIDRLRLLWPWLQLVWEEKPHGPDPLSPLFWETVRQVNYLGYRFVVWVNLAVSGGTSSDNLIFVLLIAMLAWLVAVLAAWGLYRWHEPLVALLPAGIFVIVNVFLADQGWGYVVTYLLCALILLVTLNLLRMQHHWQRHGMDYSTELPFDVGFASGWLATGLVLLALPLPGLTTNPVARAWWNTLSQPWSEVETTVNRLFSGLNNPNQPIGAGARSSLVLGGSFDPRPDSPVFMYVTTDEAIPELRELLEMDEDAVAPAHYWRGLAYDSYTGRGWQNTERVMQDRRPDQPVLEVSGKGFFSLTQQVEIMRPRVDVIYAANQPVTVSVPYNIQSMGADDYAALVFRDPPLTEIRYSVLSLVPRLGEEDLRASPTVYPAWVTKRYLQLPTTLPQRVIDLSKQLTAESKTPYDKALAIQAYLRQLPYDPQILLPAGDFDAVDYFLFLQKGYCDYFGTAMAVLLRSVGVPTRVARGYLPGEYDWTRRQYVVKENRLHVWTEIYFPPYGWIEFEPTPGQPAIVYPPGSLLNGTLYVLPEPLPEPADEPDPLAALGEIGRTLLTLLGIALLVVLGWTLFPAWESRLSPTRYAAVIYRRMRLYAGWGGVNQRPSQTPSEYAAAVGMRLADEPAGLPFWRWRLSRWTTPPQAGQDVAAIASAYQAASYGSRPLEQDDRSRVQQAWRAVKAGLWRLVLARERWLTPRKNRRH